MAPASNENLAQLDEQNIICRPERTNDISCGWFRLQLKMRFPDLSFRFLPQRRVCRTMVFRSCENWGCELTVETWLTVKLTVGVGSTCLVIL
jgi:hypothetical protein